MLRLTVLGIVHFLFLQIAAQPAWLPFDRVTDAHLRGLSMAGDSVIWASGTGATWIRSVDAGYRWYEDTVPGAQGMDLRDVHAFDGDRALVMTAGSPGMIFLTEDGGISWEKVYENHHPEIFLDGMDFSGDKNGYAFGDPVNGHFFVLKTNDGGRNWSAVDTALLPEPLPGEAGFAASGTGIMVRGEHIRLATGGGGKARVLTSDDDGRSWKVTETPMRSGDGSGIFSIAFADENKGVVVGGSYMDSTSTQGVCAYSVDGGLSWMASPEPPSGYRSCVALFGQRLIAVGRTGSDCSTDGGKTWKPMGKEGYYACAFGQTRGWAVGRSGKMAVFSSDGK